MADLKRVEARLARVRVKTVPLSPADASGVDLGAVSFLGSTGLVGLLPTRDTADDRVVVLALTGVAHRPVARALELTALDRVFRQLPHLPPKPWPAQIQLSRTATGPEPRDRRRARPATTLLE